MRGQDYRNLINFAVGDCILKFASWFCQLVLQLSTGESSGADRSAVGERTGPRKDLRVGNLGCDGVIER